MYLPPAFVACLSEMWVRLTSRSIVKAGTVDQAVLIDQAGSAVWGKSDGFQVLDSTLSRFRTTHGLMNCC